MGTSKEGRQGARRPAQNIHISRRRLHAESWAGRDQAGPAHGGASSRADVSQGQMGRATEWWRGAEPGQSSAVGFGPGTGRGGQAGLMLGRGTRRPEVLLLPVEGEARLHPWAGGEEAPGPLQCPGTCGAPCRGQGGVGSRTGSPSARGSSKADPCGRDRRRRLCVPCGHRAEGAEAGGSGVGGGEEEGAGRWRRRGVCRGLSRARPGQD